MDVTICEEFLVSESEEYGLKTSLRKMQIEKLTQNLALLHENEAWRHRDIHKERRTAPCFTIVKREQNGRTVPTFHFLR